MTNSCAHEIGPWPAGQQWPRCLKCEIEQLRGNLSLAEEGLANYALEVAELKRWQLEARKLMQGADATNPRRELTGDVPNSQYAAVLTEAEAGGEVHILDLLDAQWWRIRNQRREIARLHERLATQKGVIANHIENERRSSEPFEQRLNPAEYGPQVVDCPCGVCAHHRKQFRDQGTPLEDYWTAERRAALKSGDEHGPQHNCPECQAKRLRMTL